MTAHFTQPMAESGRPKITSHCRCWSDLDKYCKGPLDLYCDAQLSQNWNKCDGTSLLFYNSLRLVSSKTFTICLSCIKSPLSMIWLLTIYFTLSRTMWLIMGCKTDCAWSQCHSMGSSWYLVILCKAKYLQQHTWFESIFSHIFQIVCLFQF